MSDASKYQPTDDEPRIQVIVRDGAWFVDPICDTHMDNQADAEAEVQRVALAIADRVHGQRLRELEAALRRLVDAVERVGDWPEYSRVGNALSEASDALIGEFEAARKAGA